VRAQVASSDGALERLLQEELVRRALLEQARSAGWDKQPEVAAAAKLASERAVVASWLARAAQVPQGYPEDKDVHAFYEANKSRMRNPAEYHLMQIFVKRPADGKADAAERRADDVARRAAAAGADFAALARAESDDQASRDKGGDLGFLAEGWMLPEVRSAVNALKPGQVSAPVATAAGWHIIKLAEVKPSTQATEDQARAAIVRALRGRKAAELRQAYLQALLKKTPPAIDRAQLPALRESLKK